MFLLYDRVNNLTLVDMVKSRQSHVGNNSLNSICHENSFGILYSTVFWGWSKQYNLLSRKLTKCNLQDWRIIFGKRENVYII